MTTDNPFKSKRGAAKSAPAVEVGGDIENAMQAAAQLLAAPFNSRARDTVRAAVDAWIGGDSERARAVTLEYYSKCNKQGVPRK